MTDTVENTQRTMIPGMGEEGEKLTVADFIRLGEARHGA